MWQHGESTGVSACKIVHNTTSTSTSWKQRNSPESKSSAVPHYSQSWMTLYRTVLSLGWRCTALLSVLDDAVPHLSQSWMPLYRNLGWRYTALPRMCTAVPHCLGWRCTAPGWRSSFASSFSQKAPAVTGWATDWCRRVYCWLIRHRFGSSIPYLGVFMPCQYRPFNKSKRK